MPRCDYANARVGAMRSRLFGRAGMRDVVSRANLGARMEFLTQSEYGGAIRAGLASRLEPLPAVEQALRTQLRRDADRIGASIEGRAQRRLFQVPFLFVDAENLQTILRGLARTEPSDRILRLTLTTPTLPEADLRELAGQHDVEAAIEVIRSKSPGFHGELARALPAYRTHKDGIHLDVALHRAALEQATALCAGKGEDAGVVRRYVRLRADLANVATLLKLEGAPSSADFYLTGGERLLPAEYRRLAETRPALRIRGAVADWVRRNLGPSLANLVRSGGTFAADSMVDRAAEEMLRREARARPLSIAVPLAFLLERMSEVKRVRLALRGTEFGLPAVEMVELLET
jgi:V/A-type H+/Na+-transporting ATPase subunit C